MRFEKHLPHDSKYGSQKLFIIDIQSFPASPNKMNQARATGVTSQTKKKVFTPYDKPQIKDNGQPNSSVKMVYVKLEVLA